MVPRKETQAVEFTLDSHLDDMQRSLWLASPEPDPEEEDSAAARIQLTMSLMSLCKHGITVLGDDTAGADRLQASYAELFAGAYQDLFHWIMERPGDDIDDKIWERLFGDWESLKGLEKTSVNIICDITQPQLIHFLGKALVYVFAHFSRGEAELPPEPVWDNFLCFHLSRLGFSSLLAAADPSDPSDSDSAPQRLDPAALARLETVMRVSLRRTGAASTTTTTTGSDDPCAASAACALARALASRAASRPPGALLGSPALFDALAMPLLDEGTRRVLARRSRARGHHAAAQQQDRDCAAVVMAGVARAAHEVLHYHVGIYARRRAGEAAAPAGWLARREGALDALLRVRHRFAPEALAGLMCWLGPEAEVCLRLDLAAILDASSGGA